MLLALRSLFEPEAVIVPPPVVPPPVRGGGFFVRPHIPGVVKLQTLSLFSVVGKITATGKARTFLEPIECKVEIGNLIPTGKGSFLLNPFELTGSIGSIQAIGRNDDGEAFFVLGNL